MEKYDEIIEQFTSLIGIGALAANARIIMLADRYTPIGALRATVISIFVGLICAAFLHDLQIDYYWKFGFVGIACVLADDILRATFKIGNDLTQRPIDLLIRIIRRD